MRVLDTRTGKFVEIDPDETKTKYAILSHTWDAAGEQTYQDVLRIQSSIVYRIETVLVWACIPAWCGFLAVLAFLSSVIHRTKPTTWRISCPRYFTTLFLIVSPISGKDRWYGGEPEEWAETLRAKALHTRRWNSIYMSYRLSAKIRCACAVARADGYDFIWIDSCCINKESSSELSEAINSMYRWYGCSHHCYAFLADVPDMEEGDLYKEGSSFRESKWFERGWTLQELIAPENVVFMSSEWNVLGSKFLLADLVESITGIEIAVLVHDKPLEEVSVATRMSWAALRETTRAEDRAYSLFGIFGVNMSTLYGEGSLAFRRLQLKILKQIPDQSIFAWAVTGYGPYLGSLPLQTSDETILSPSDISSVSFYALHYGESLLADSPYCFQHSGHIRPIPHHTHLERLARLGVDHKDGIQYYTSTAHGIRTELPFLDIRACLPPKIVGYVALEDAQWYVAILGCASSDKDEEHFLARVCYAPSSQSDLELMQPGYLAIKQSDGEMVLAEIVILRYSEVEQCAPHLAVKTIYIPHPKYPQPSAYFGPFPHDFYIIPLRWAGRMLEAQGYAVTFSQPSADGPRSCRLTVSKGGEAIHIRCWGDQPDPFGEMRVDLEASMTTDDVSSASDDRPTSSGAVSFFQGERQIAFNVDATTAAGTIRVPVVWRRTSKFQVVVYAGISHSISKSDGDGEGEGEREMQTSQGTQERKVTVCWRWEPHVF